MAVEQPQLLAQPAEDLVQLTDAAIGAAVAAVPDSWWREPDRPARVREALGMRRDQLPATIFQIMELRR